MSHSVNDQILDNLSVEVGTSTISNFIREHTDTANAIVALPYNGHLTQIRERSTAVAQIASQVVHGVDNGFPEPKASFYKATWDDVVDHLEANYNRLTKRIDDCYSGRSRYSVKDQKRLTRLTKQREFFGQQLDVMREAFHDIVDYKFDQKGG
tara:strand:+ start:2558 stop:3016 length:459 start_codon:yes stop_codon:yes gene_type:complete